MENFAKLLAAGNYPGMNVGDKDLYKAFIWRFWFTTSNVIGKIGVLLPRTSLVSKGSESFRKELFKNSSSIEITSLLNSNKWVFNIHPQFTVSLISISKSKTYQQGLSFKGPYDSMKAFSVGKKNKPLKIKVDEVMSWSDEAAIITF